MQRYATLYALYWQKQVLKKNKLENILNFMIHYTLEEK